jgi:Ca-activated chloride channel family protein
MSVGRDWQTGAHQATLQISLTTPIDPSKFQRLPMSLVVVVDHSGSMANDDRLTKVKVGLHTLIDHLRDEDRLAIVEFDDVIDVDATFEDQLDRPRLHAIIDGMKPRGATNIFGGLERGFQLLGDEPASERQNRVILLSDGLATAGNTSQVDIQDMARRRVQHGIGLTTIGVGDEFDVTLMRGLAEQGAGNFYFLEDPAAATEVFTEELDYFMQPIALDIQVAATAGPGYRFGPSVGSALWTGESFGGAMAIPAVFIASRTSQGGEIGRRGGGSMIFIPMTPGPGNTGRVADVTLSFRTPGSSERVSQSFALDYTQSPDETPDEPFLSEPEMAERFAMYNMYLGISAATKAFPSCAASVLQATRASAVAWNLKHEDPDLAADIALVDQYLQNLEDYGADLHDATAQCAAGPGHDPQPIDWELDEDDRYRGCSASGPSGSLALVLGSLAGISLASVRRRRRR